MKPSTTSKENVLVTVGPALTDELGPVPVPARSAVWSSCWFAAAAVAALVAPWLPMCTVKVSPDEYRVDGWGRDTIVRLAATDSVDAATVPYGAVLYAGAALLLVAAWAAWRSPTWVFPAASLALGGVIATGVYQ